MPIYSLWAFLSHTWGEAEAESEKRFLPLPLPVRDSEYKALCAAFWLHLRAKEIRDDCARKHCLGLLIEGTFLRA